MAKTKSKSKSPVWFIRTRGSYLPTSWQAWLLYIPYTVYLVGVLVYVFQQHDTLGDALFTLVPNWIAAIAVMSWIAQRCS